MAKLPRPPAVGELRQRDPEWTVLPAGGALWRVHLTEGRHVVPWNQLRTYGPVTSCRFDPHEPPPHFQAEGVAYLARDISTALAEVFQADRLVDRYRLAPYLTGFVVRSDLLLLDLTGSWPLTVGASHAINTGRRDYCRLWARAFRQAWPEAAGLLHSSSMTGRDCVTLFTPGAGAFPERPSFSAPLAQPDLAVDLAGSVRQIGYRMV